MLDRIVSARKYVDKQLATKQVLESDIEDLQNQEKSLVGDIENLQSIISFVNAFADERQKELNKVVETVITSGLRNIFEDPSLEFKLKFKYQLELEL